MPQKKPEILVTPEMVKAGLEAFYSESTLADDYQTNERLVTKIYRAMSKASAQ